jgi:hypothetical protein
MKRSHIPSGTASGTPRLCRFVLPVTLALSAMAAPAQQYSVVGQWRGVFQGITITIVIQPNGQYSQLTQKGTAMAQQSGPYKLFAPNTIAFSVTEWQPKTMPVYHATGTTGGYYTQQPMVKPPNAMFTYVFNGPNTMILTDQLLHGSMTMVRVP